VLAWMLGRVDGTAPGQENVFGISPRYDDLNWQGLDFTREQYAQVISIDRAAWTQELALHAELFQTLQHRLPAALTQTKAQIETRLQSLA
jgi:phosphoenolpyruvate carboxykinase (GTP)